MNLEITAIALSLVAVLISVGAVIWVRLKLRSRSTNISVEKITLPGYEVKVVNGELSFTPKK